MPTYDYRCEICTHAFEAFQAMTDDKLTRCPRCGAQALMRLLAGGTGIIFRGTGFYQTDYKYRDTGKRD